MRYFGFNDAMILADRRKTDEDTRVYPADVVLFEGILVFYFPEVRELFHMKLFVDTDPDTRLARRGDCTCWQHSTDLVSFAQ